MKTYKNKIIWSVIYTEVPIMNKDGEESEKVLLNIQLIFTIYIVKKRWLGIPENGLRNSRLPWSRFRKLLF